MEISPLFLGMVPVVIGLVAVLKIYINSFWAPLTSLVLGIGSAFLVTDVGIGATVIGGIVIGLMASGLYSGVSKMTS